MQNSGSHGLGIQSLMTAAVSIIEPRVILPQPGQDFFYKFKLMPRAPESAAPLGADDDGSASR